MNWAKPEGPTTTHRGDKVRSLVRTLLSPLDLSCSLPSLSRSWLLEEQRRRRQWRAAGRAAAAQRRPPSARSGGRKGGDGGNGPAGMGGTAGALSSARSGRRGGTVAADGVEAGGEATTTYCSRRGGNSDVLQQEGRRQAVTPMERRWAAPPLSHIQWLPSTVTQRWVFNFFPWFGWRWIDVEFMWCFCDLCGDESMLNSFCDLCADESMWWFCDLYGDESMLNFYDSEMLILMNCCMWDGELARASSRFFFFCASQRCQLWPRVISAASEMLVGKPAPKGFSISTFMPLCSSVVLLKLNIFW